MAVVVPATAAFKVGMMIASKPVLIVDVAAAVSLAVVGPVTLRRPAMLAIGLLVLLRPFMVLLRPGRPLLIPIGSVRSALLFLLRFLLAVILPLILFGRLGWMLLGFGVLLVLRFGLGSLILLGKRGSENSQREGQSPHRYQSDWFHTFNDPLDHLWRMQPPMVGLHAVWLLVKIADSGKGLYIVYR